MLDNLLSDAIECTPAPGRVIVMLERVQGARPAQPGAPAGAAWAVARVAGSGPGIPPDRRETIFDEFTRLHDDGRATRHGLAIARRIAQLLGGDVTVVAGGSEGATFHLRLPYDAPTAVDDPLQAQPRPTDPRLAHG